MTDISTPPLRVIFFDAAGTLFHLPRGVGHHYGEVLGRHGVTVADDALTAAFREVWAAMPPPPTTGQARPDDDKGWWRELVHRVLDHCAIQADRGPLFEDLYAEFVRPSVWTLFPETLQVLTELSRHFTLGVITNFDGRYRTIARDLGLEPFFTHVVISSEVGADKPDPLIFQRSLEIAQVSASEALHVGDDPACDWQGAAAAGLQVFRLDRPRNSLLELLTFVATVPPGANSGPASASS